MARYCKRPVPVEAITFDELVAHGVASGAEISRGLPDGLPMAFKYLDRDITLKENGRDYWVPTPRGRATFSRGDMLVSDAVGSLLVFSAGDFTKVYIPIPAEGAQP